MAKSLINRGEYIYVIAPDRPGVLRFLRRIIELDPGGRQRCVDRVRRAFLRAFGQPPQVIRRNARAEVSPE